MLIVNEKIPDIDILELPIPIHRQQRVLHRSCDNRDRVEFYLDLALSCIMNEYPASKRFCKKNLAQLFHELNNFTTVYTICCGIFLYTKKFLLVVGCQTSNENFWVMSKFFFFNLYLLGETENDIHFFLLWLNICMRVGWKRKDTKKKKFSTCSYLAAIQFFEEFILQ